MTPNIEPQTDFRFDAQRYPAAPGCYLIKGADGQVLFAGMARNLRRRLSAFFDGSLRPSDDALPGRLRYRDVRPQILARIREIEVILIENETDCTNLVNALITRLRPYFNLATFLDPFGTSYIIQTQEALPRFIPAPHKRVAKNALPRGVTAAAAYGPYPFETRDALLKCANQLFGLRTCDPLPGSACLSYRLKKCSAPCENRISREEYNARVEQAADLLSAPVANLLAYLQKQMQAAAQSLDFERARLLRDLAAEIEETAAAQVTAPPVDHDQDVIWTGGGKAVTLHLKNGRLDSLSEYAVPVPEDEITPFLTQHYRQNCPAELITQPLPGAAAMAVLLSASNGFPVTVNTGEGQRACELLRAAQANHTYRTASSQ